jgi:hypothetical protein
MSTTMSSYSVLRGLLFCSSVRYTPRMSIRKAGGDWESMLLGIEPRTCKVCGKGLYRNVTMFRGGWSRCTRCNEFVHYSCLASGAVSFLKRRPRVCKSCLTEKIVTNDLPIEKAVGT